MSDSSSGAEPSERTEVASLTVAIVALVIASVALLGTMAQVMQQYLATAVGYSNCGKRVMGPWAKYTKLAFHPWELRFEVIFSSPEISVEFWPVGVPDDTYVRGLPIVTFKDRYSSGSRRQGHDRPYNVYYAAHWLALLQTVHDMELQGRMMQDNFWSLVSDPVEKQEPSGMRIRVRVSAKIQTLDLMPEGVKKPYATTTLSSIVHLAAVLGVH